MAARKRGSFPKRRDYSEDYALVVKAQAGDVDARNQLVLKHSGFIFSVVERCVPPGEADEFMADAVLAFMHVVSKFRVESGLSLLTPAYVSIWRVIHREIEKSRVISIKTNGSNATETRRAHAERARRVCFVGERDWIMGGVCRRRGDRGGAWGASGGGAPGAEMAAEVRACVHELPEREQVVLRGRMDGRSIRSLGDELGISRQTVLNLEKAAIRRCRAMLGLEEDEEVAA